MSHTTETSSEQTASRDVLIARKLCRQVQGPGGVMDILNDVSLSVKKGEAIAIIGPSGSGKSTLLGLLAGLDLPTSGEVELLGQNMTHLNEDLRARLRAGNVGFVFQTFHLLQGFTALENVQMALELAGQFDSTQAAQEMLQALGMQHRLHHYPEQLSGGEQQRVALARAFVTRPHLMFADEPTGNLDSVNGQTTIDLLFSLREQYGASLVLVTHDVSLAERCDRCLTIRDGRIVTQ